MSGEEKQRFFLKQEYEISKNNDFEPVTDLFKESDKFKKQLLLYLSQTIDANDPAIKSEIEEYQRKNNRQMSVMMQMEGLLDLKYRDSIHSEIDKLKQELQFYVDEY